MEERVLVDLLGVVGVADEHELDRAVLAGEEEVEQREEALGEVLLLLVHRGGHVHEAEHHGACDGLGTRHAVAEAHVGIVEERRSRAGGAPRAPSSRAGRRPVPHRPPRWRPQMLPAGPGARGQARRSARCGARVPGAWCARRRDWRGHRCGRSRSGWSCVLWACPNSVRARRGRARSSKKICMNSSRDRENTKSSWASPSPPWLPLPPEPPDSSLRGMRSPAVYSRLPGNTRSRSPPRPKPNDGSEMSLRGTRTSPPCSRSESLRSPIIFRTASCTCFL